MATVPPTPHTPLFPQVTQASKRAFLLAYAQSCNVSKAAQAAGVSHALHYHWKQHDLAYREAFAEAQVLAGEYLEAVAVKRATEGEHPSDTLLIFLLKGAMPEKYRDSARREDRQEISELLKAVLLELSERSQPKDVTPAAEWAPRPPGERPTNGTRPPLPAPPGLAEDEGQ